MVDVGNWVWNGFANVFIAIFFCTVLGRSYFAIIGPLTGEGDREALVCFSTYHTYVGIWTTIISMS